MAYKLVYTTVRDDHPRKVIHAVRVVDALLESEEIEELAARMRAHMLAKHGEQEATIVVVQGNTKETLRLFGEPYAVARVRAAMFNAAIRWSEFILI
jgi:hypothetical protein